MPLWETHIVTVDHAGLTVEEYIRQVLCYSGRRLQKLTREKGLRLNEKPVFLQKKVKIGDRLQIAAPLPDSGKILPEEGTVVILYEDAHLLILNKPAGLLVHPTGRTTSGTVANFLAFHLRQRGLSLPIRPLHRLDRDTSGCLIFAKDAPSQTRLEAQLSTGVLKRCYHALVHGHLAPTAGAIAAPIGPHPRLANRRMVHATGESAVTHYQTLRTFTEHSLLELFLETGRTHQIRVHLAHVGHPVLGDGMYGHRSSLIAHQALHAATVTFRRFSDDTPVTVEAPWPMELERATQRCAIRLIPETPSPKQSDC